MRLYSVRTFSKWRRAWANSMAFKDDGAYDAANKTKNFNRMYARGTHIEGERVCHFLFILVSENGKL